MTTEIRPLSSANETDINGVLDAAFGADRHKRTAYLLRDGMAQIDALCFALFEGGTLIGSIQCWPVQIGAAGENTPIIMVGPVAVHPAKQNDGGGHLLMNAMLDQAAKMDNPAMMLIGDQEYYGRFGFSNDATNGWTLPGEWETHRLLCRNPAGYKLPASGMAGPRE